MDSYWVVGGFSISIISSFIIDKLLDLFSSRCSDALFELSQEEEDSEVFSFIWDDDFDSLMDFDFDISKFTSFSCSENFIFL